MPRRAGFATSMREGWKRRYSASRSASWASAPDIGEVQAPRTDPTSNPMTRVFIAPTSPVHDLAATDTFLRQHHRQIKNLALSKYRDRDAVARLEHRQRVLHAVRLVARSRHRPPSGCGRPPEPS